MDLPSEIWEKIIVEIKDVKECIKLFKSFPKITQKYIRNIFDNHIQAIKVKILYCYQNCLFLAIENKNIMIMKYSDIFNIPWFKFLLYKKITNIYLVSCAFLIGSHALIISNYLSNNPDDPNILRNTLIIIFSCFISFINKKE